MNLSDRSDLAAALVIDSVFLLVVAVVAAAIWGVITGLHKRAARRELTAHYRAIHTGNGWGNDALDAWLDAADDYDTCQAIAALPTRDPRKENR